MTQAIDRQPLALQLTPMQISASTPGEVADVTALPEALRQLVMWIAYQDEVSLPAVQTYTGEPEATIRSWLSSLQQGGFIEPVTVAGVVHYRRAQTANRHLMLNPEEPSQMIVQLKNQSSQTLHLTLSVEGNFPAEWCRLSIADQAVSPRQSIADHAIAPGHQIDAVLDFRVPSNFFENYQTVTLGQPLTIDYSGQLNVTYRDPASHPQHEAAIFQLHVRPHSLYTRFLPSIYSEVDLVGRFLKIFEQAFEPAVWTLNTMWAHLDPLTAPQSMLPFLAYWVAWNPDPRWSSDRQRRLIRNAMEIYRWRGTRRGLRFYLHLYTDLPLDEDRPEAEKHICIEEVFSQGLVIGEAAIRNGSIGMLGGGRPYHFIVRLRREHPDQVIDEALVRSIIEQEKPAFCTYDLSIENV